MVPNDMTCNIRFSPTSNTKNTPLRCNPRCRQTTHLSSSGNPHHHSPIPPFPSLAFTKASHVHPNPAHLHRLSPPAPQIRQLSPADLTLRPRAIPALLHISLQQIDPTSGLNSRGPNTLSHKMSRPATLPLKNPSRPLSPLHPKRPHLSPSGTPDANSQLLMSKLAAIEADHVAGSTVGSALRYNPLLRRTRPQPLHLRRLRSRLARPRANRRRPTPSLAGNESREARRAYQLYVLPRHAGSKAGDRWRVAGSHLFAGGGARVWPAVLCWEIWGPNGRSVF
jgi:hypothetical protein